MLGVAGASFAVALPLASQWYPLRFQGLALGIAGAGNSSTVFSPLFAPRLAEHFGWRTVFGLAIVPLMIVLMVFVLFARETAELNPNLSGSSVISRSSSKAISGGSTVLIWCKNLTPAQR
jgi:nitrate/nitrite transporter NarK